jgi:uncharacterized protein YdeI (YjbR/CyaY-like superfamily)
MGKLDDAERVFAETADEWRLWLAANHAAATGVWLVTWRPSTGRPAPDYEDTILEALCVGWIDGTVRPVDDERVMGWFAPRSASSGWAATNKARVERLLSEGRMRPAGQRLMDIAKHNGMWTVLDDAENDIVAPDLQAALDAIPGASAAWQGFPRSVRKLGLTNIAMARKPETRAARIAKIATDAGNGIRPS